MKKRIFAALLALCAAAALLPAGALAAEEPAGDAPPAAEPAIGPAPESSDAEGDPVPLPEEETETVSVPAAGAAEDEESPAIDESVSWSLENGVLTISGQGAMKNYDIDSPAPWASQRADITSVDIGDGITAIGDYAFRACTGLEHIAIPDSVTSIGRYAFYRCSELKDVDLGEGVTVIGAGAFGDCGTLKRVVIPNSVTSIGIGAFYWCAMLEYVSLSDNLTSIGAQAFAYCRSLAACEIPDGVTVIGSEAFRDCSSLTELYLPDGLTAIAESTFAGCSGLRMLYFPASIKFVGVDAFQGCESLDRILYPGTEEQLSELAVADGNNILFTEIFYLIVTESPFEDVTGSSETNWYYDPVLWAVNMGVTNGTSETTFSPGDCCTRAQAVTFLWRAAGEPEPASTKMAFTDVAEDAYYYDAVLWAMEQEITNGTSETTFSPNASCTRAQIVTFLYRLDREPGIAGETAFPDVKEEAYYYAAVLWATEAGITNGISATAFGPDNYCTRAQIVTFLYRYATGPEA